MNPQHLKQLQFAIDFAQIENLNDSAVMDGHEAFFGERWDPAIPPRGFAKSLIVICAEARFILRQAAAGRSTGLIPAKIKTALVSHNGHPVVIYRGSYRDLFMLRLVQLIEEAGADRLRNCPLADCGRVFLKVTKKKFCSTRCQSRAWMRTKRARDKGTGRKERANAKKTRTR